MKPLSETAAKRQVNQLQAAIVEGLEDVKAQNIQVFDTAAITPLFERVIVASGTSSRQTKALAASVRDKVREAGFPKPSIGGEDNGEWVTVDCGTIVAHIMQPAIREYYRLEEIWGEKPLKPAAKKKAASESAEPAGKTAAKKTKAAKTVTVETATEETTAKKTATKKSTQTATKMAALEQGVEGKVATRKTATKQATAGVAVAKKTVAKKTVAKKAAAKKAAVKKAVAKKTSGKTT